MRRFVVQVVLLAVAITATILVLSVVSVNGVPLLTITPDVEPLLELEILLGPVRVDLGVGLVMALMIRVLPVVAATFFGRWYLRYPAPALVIVNGVLFWAVAVVSGLVGLHFVVPEPALLWLFVDSVAFSLVYLALDVVFGFERPHLGDRPRHRSLWARLDRLPASDRNVLVENLRLFEVWRTITGFVQDIALSGTPLRRLRGVGDRLSGTKSASLDQLSAPAKFRVMLQQLGPTYVKLGQMIGSRREMLPAEWISELERLQSDVPPFPWPVAASIIESELGRPLDVLFASIDETPLAAASLAQAHRATLHDGRMVVVKVQRPDISAKVRADLGVMQELALVGEQKFAVARRMGLRDIVGEFGAGVREELDYTIEAYNARRLADVLKDIEGVGVPAIHPDVSSRRVLVMDFVSGVKATRVEQLDASIDRSVVARALVAALIKQLLIDGFFHGDPHPGNVVLDPQTGRVTFLDLGLMGELRLEQRLDLMALVWALCMGDPGMLASVTRRLCRPVGPVDEAAFHAAIERIFYRAWRYGNGAFSGVMSAVFETLGQQNLRMRRELVLAVKALMQAEELIRAIDPDLPLIGVVVDEAKGLIVNQVKALETGALTSDVPTLVVALLPRASSLGDRFLPTLLAAVAGRGEDGTPTRPPEDEPVAATPDDIGRLASPLARLATVVALAGVGISAAIVTGTADAGRDAELIRVTSLAATVGSAVASLILVRRWHVRDTTSAPFGGTGT